MVLFSKILGGATFLLLMAAGAVVAEPPLPLLSFYDGDELVEERRMTPPEHTAFMKLELAMGTLNSEKTAEAFGEASAEFVRESLDAISDSVEVTPSSSGNGTDIHVDVDFSFEKLTDAIAQGGIEIGKYAQRVGLAAEKLEAEIEKNSGSLEYDSVAIGEGEDRFNLTID